MPFFLKRLTKKKSNIEEPVNVISFDRTNIDIESLIRIIRGQKVMVDFDLAKCTAVPVIIAKIIILLPLRITGILGLGIYYLIDGIRDYKLMSFLLST